MTDFFNLKIVAISHFISRSGTLYLHSLLDNHPQIATIPATINIENLLKIKEKFTVEECYQIFKNNNPKFFDTSKFTPIDKNNSSLWMLGENKNEKIITNEATFRKNFIFSLEDQEINPKNVLISLYYAYAKTHNQEIKNFKLILMHPHEKKTTIRFSNYFKDALYIIPIRNPVRAYKSVIKKTRYMSKMRKKEYYPSGQLLENALDIEEFYKKRLDMYFIRLESLGLNLKNIILNISKLLGINYNPSMLKSTFGGKKYWSNSINSPANHFDESKHNDEVNLPRKDKIILIFVNLVLVDKLNYKNLKLTFLEKLTLPFLIFLPLKDEIDFLKDFKLSEIRIYLKFIIFFFPKRLILLLISLKNLVSKKYDYIVKRLIN